MRIRTACLSLLFLLTSCVMPGSTTPVVSPVGSTTGIPLAGPTGTPTPVISLVILVIPADMPQADQNTFTTTVYDLAQGSGFNFTTRSSLTTTDVQTEPGLSVVIAFAPDPGLMALAAAAPSVQFLGVGIQGLTLSANLSTIGAASDTYEQQAFVAGYMAAMLAVDYRVGLVSMENVQGKAAIDAFTNGRTFFCGLCNPAFPPFTYKYPAHPEIPVGTPLVQYPFFSDYLLDYLVEVAYVDPQVATPDLLDYMAQNGLKIIGEHMLFEDLRSNWVASIQPNVVPAIQQLWPELVAGRGGQNLPTPLFLADVNPDLLPEGKQGLVEQLLSDLNSGLVGTGITP